MKFSIRELLLVTVIVALAVGWAVDRSRLAREAAREKENAEDFHELLDVFAPEWGAGMPKDVLDRLAPDYKAPPDTPVEIVPGPEAINLRSHSAPATNPPKP